LQDCVRTTMKTKQGGKALLECDAHLSIDKLRTNGCELRRAAAKC